MARVTASFDESTTALEVVADVDLTDHRALDPEAARRLWDVSEALLAAAR